MAINVNPLSLRVNRSPWVWPSRASAFVPVDLNSQKSIVVCVRKGCTRSTQWGEGDGCTYQLVKTHCTNGEMDKHSLATLSDLSDLGELCAPEIALEDAKKRLESERAHQRFQENEFEHGWHRSGHAFECTRFYSQKTMRQQRAKSARHIERLNEQIRKIEHAVARFPTPSTMLAAFREKYEETRAEAARRFAEWEARLVDGMAPKV